MAPSRERNDRHRPPAGGRPPGFARAKPRRSGSAAAEGTEWLWGRHTVEAALANPERRLRRVLAAADRVRPLEALLAHRAGGEAPRVETVEPTDFVRLLPERAVHQGAAVLADALDDPGIDAVAAARAGPILVLDGVTDPQNVGAILRSAAAFGARAMVLQERRSPAVSGALAKAAAGAVERVPVVRVVNLARALDRLADSGWRAVGLTADGEAALAEAVAGFAGEPLALVLGSEGEGLRRLVGEHCDTLAAIPMPGGFESLNVSAAAAVALYETARAQPRRATAKA